MRHQRKIPAAVVVGVAVAVATSFAATPAHATHAKSYSSTASQVRTPPKEQGLGECVDILNTYGYQSTFPRIAACTAAAGQYPTPEAALAGCFSVLVGTGVGGWVATVACTAGAYA
jgi:hypothetical protein